MTVGISFTWLFYAAVFYLAWSRQRKKDTRIIIPQITELQKIQADLSQK
ncbi:MAG: hypothetical protein R3C61_16355 [Bacteroidia bacterium]